MVCLRRTGSFLFIVIFIMFIYLEVRAKESDVVFDNMQEEVVLSATDTEEEIVLTEEKDGKEDCGYILIGDSRFVMMRKSVNMSKHKDVFIIAKKSKGYDWLMKIAIPEARKIIKQNPDIAKWKIAVNLGVNDLGNREQYIKKYKKLANEWELYLISVNPVNNYRRISNKSIIKFNSAMKKLKNISYIDTYKVMMEEGFCTFDGCHYTRETSKDIFAHIMRVLRE